MIVGGGHISLIHAPILYMGAGSALLVSYSQGQLICSITSTVLVEKVSGPTLLSVAVEEGQGQLSQLPQMAKCG